MGGDRVDAVLATADCGRRSIALEVVRDP